MKIGLSTFAFFIACAALAFALYESFAPCPVITQFVPVGTWSDSIDDCVCACGEAQQSVYDAVQTD